ncbi:ATP-binding protein [Actinomadura geliboluensis]|uniref:ATP-binding protein n=1 Tax=Actinomadura geliboluensis TaxID=882440 RepID=UPI00371A64BC
MVSESTPSRSASRTAPRSTRLRLNGIRGRSSVLLGRVITRSSGRTLSVRADEARARANRGGGAGRGLAIVDSPVRADGGHVEVRTTPDTGTTFRALLPPHP